MLTLAPLFALAAALTLFCGVAQAMPPLAARQAGQPAFPAQPASCPICAQNYAGISSCAQAAPVLANVSMVLFNPGAFIDVIKCACTDTFQSGEICQSSSAATMISQSGFEWKAYPQCVDCFEKTNQTSFLNTTDPNSVVGGIQSICDLASTLFGGAPSADGEVSSTSSGAAAPTAAAVSSAESVQSPPGIVSAAFALLIAVSVSFQPL